MPWCRHVSGYWQGSLRHRHRRHAGRLQGGHQAGRALVQEVEVVFCNFVHFYVFHVLYFWIVYRFICKLIKSRYEFLYPPRPAWFLRCFLSAEVINFLCWEEEVCVFVQPRPPPASSHLRLNWGRDTPRYVVIWSFYGTFSNSCSPKCPKAQIIDQNVLLGH